MTQHDSMQFRQGNSKDLLRMGLRGPGRPVDQLVELLEKVDAGGWLTSALAAHESTANTEAYPEGSHTTEQLEALKEEAKRRGSGASADVTAAQATAAYFVAVAAALTEHGTKISSAPAEELRMILLDLASVTGGSWQEFWTSAVRALKSIY